MPSEKTTRVSLEKPRRKDRSAATLRRLGSRSCRYPAPPSLILQGWARPPVRHPGLQRAAGTGSRGEGREGQSARKDGELDARGYGTPHRGAGEFAEAVQISCEDDIVRGAGRAQDLALGKPELAGGEARRLGAQRLAASHLCQNGSV